QEFRLTYGQGDLSLIKDDDGKLALVSASTGATYVLPTISTTGTLNVAGSDQADQIQVDHVTGIAPGGDAELFTEATIKFPPDLVPFKPDQHVDLAAIVASDIVGITQKFSDISAGGLANVEREVANDPDNSALKDSRDYYVKLHAADQAMLDRVQN